MIWFLETDFINEATEYKSVVYSYADVAQLAEQLICNQQVIGSSPIIGLWMDSRVVKGGRL